MGEDGFIVSDKARFDVFVGIMGGEHDFARMLKKRRLLRPAAERALNELVDHGLVDRDDSGKVTLTTKGEDVSRDLKRQDALR